MKKRTDYTPNSQITAAIRQLWLRSRERASCLKRDNYSCVHCGKKQSVSKSHPQKVEVHHRDGIEWQAIRDYIRRHVLVEVSKLETVCPDCHEKITKGETP